MLNQNKHKQILIKILKEIYEDNDINKYLGFKGGTMAYIFYELNRFSVDIDLDLLDIAKEEIVQQKIKIILEKYGKVKQEDNKRYSIFFMMSYEIDGHNIKVDINKRNFNSKYEIKNYLGINMLCMKSEYMVAHKMVAMYERIGEANRDVFDTHYFLSKNLAFDTQTIKNRSGLDYPNFVDECVKRLETLKSNTLLSGLGELVDEKQKFWIKNKMVKDTIFLLNLSKE